MKIALNYTPYIKGQVGGMGDYMIALLYFLPRISPKDDFFIIHRKASLTLEKLPNLHSIEIQNPSSQKDLTNSLLKVIKENRFDLWYSPLLILDPAPCPIPSVFNIPDMQHEYFPNFFDSATLLWRKKEYANSAKYADGIITLSKRSRMDIIRLLDVDPKRVFYTYLDAAPDSNKPLLSDDIILKRFDIVKKKFLYFPANTWPHKNHDRLIEAFSLISERHKDISLVFTGFSYDNWTQIKKIIRQQKLSKQIKILNYVKKEEMSCLYRNALGLVFPSLFEGFGIPLVEAMRSDCPIVCSNVTSIPEVVGKAAVFFDPISIADIKEKLELFIGDAQLRQKLVSNAAKQKQIFSYEQTARQTMEIFNQIIDNHKQENASLAKTRWPRISIITPSYNQGKYIERTILSVLNQNYPNLQYIVVDGGSTDNTISVLKKYSNNIIWFSEKDNGQTDAINKGLKLADGEIVAYLNSDDTYEPDSLKTIASFFLNNPQESFVFGLGEHIDDNDDFIETYPNEPTDFEKLHGPCTICQPTAFWKRSLIRQVGYLDDALKFAMDYDYWIRISKKVKLNFIPKHLANTRLYPETKTLGQRLKVHFEINEVQLKHYPKISSHWIMALTHAKLEKFDHSRYPKEVIYRMSIILISLYYFLKYNKEFPPNNIRNLYYQWTKDLIKFPIVKVFSFLK